MVTHLGTNMYEDTALRRSTRQDLHTGHLLLVIFVTRSAGNTLDIAFVVGGNSLGYVMTDYCKAV